MVLVSLIPGFSVCTKIAIANPNTKNYKCDENRILVIFKFQFLISLKRIAIPANINPKKKDHTITGYCVIKNVIK